MSWTVTVDESNGSVTLVNPAGETVVTGLTGDLDGGVEADPLGVPTDPDIRSEAAAHLSSEVQAGNITVADAIDWAMARFEVTDE